MLEKLYQPYEPYEVHRISFPVGVDVPGKTALPLTMERYQLRGTPSILLVDPEGVLRAHHFGQVHPLQLGAEIASLAAGGLS